MVPELGSSPKISTSRKCIKYINSSWRVHQFEVWKNELVCKVVVLRMEGSVLVWIGDDREPALGELALGLPRLNDTVESSKAIATPLIGGGELGVPMARRLAAYLTRPVYITCGANFDRFTIPIVERGLMAEIKSRPECF